MMLETMPLTEPHTAQVQIARLAHDQAIDRGLSHVRSTMRVGSSTEWLIQLSSCDFGGGLFSAVKAMAATGCDLPTAGTSIGLTHLPPMRSIKFSNGDDECRLIEATTSDQARPCRPRRTIVATILATLLLTHIQSL